MKTCDQQYLDSKLASGLKVGDGVRVVECAGIPNSLARDFHGRIGFITKDSKWDFVVTFYEGVYCFSHFNLEKIEIEDKEPALQFKPFDKVLVRDSINDPWKPALYGYTNTHRPYRHVVTPGITMKYCIPYECNEHLVGTVTPEI